LPEAAGAAAAEKDDVELSAQNPPDKGEVGLEDVKVEINGPPNADTPQTPE